MAREDSVHLKAEQPADDLSPVKRALVEIRRLRAELEDLRSGYSEPVAIIGLAVRLPGGVTSPERFWEALAEGVDLITTVPPDRWDAQAYWSLDPDQPGTMYDIHGGFLSDVDAFDAEFFGINAREAASMDPQQRILLELTWEGLERAAIDPRSLMNTQTGIYLGLTNSDYGRQLTEDSRKIDGYTGVGAAVSIAAGRLAYFLGTHGPAVVIDTACSSSLVAVHQAVQSLRRRETDLSIVGAANLILSPEMNVSFSRTRMLSRDGRCRTFDASADGYVRSEGCCVVVLKRLSDAVRDGDRVLAKIHGTAVNQDGRSAGITAPNGPAQEAVMRAALADAVLAPDAVSYVEAHGTGTPLGDPMEVQAIGAVYGSGRSATSPLRLGSVKTNLGHTEAAAGLTGMIKVVLMMQPGHSIAPHLHFKQPSPQIDWPRWPIEIPVKSVAWSNEHSTRYAGVSSFGFSGTNAHVILGSAEGSQTSREISDETRPSEQEEVLCFSAAQESTLQELAKRYVNYLGQGKESFRDICVAAAVGRAKFNHRLALRSRTAAGAAEMLERWLAGRPVAGLMATGKDGLVTTLQSTNDDDVLGRMQKEFAQGGSPPYVRQTVPGQARQIDLPVYPFQRRRFWFGEPPQVRLRREREEVWQSVRAEAERQSLHGPLGWSLQNYPARWRALEKLTRAYARNVLVSAGAFRDETPLSVDDVLRQCAIQPIYRRLIGRWLSGLAEEGALVQTGETFRAVGGLQPIALELFWQDAARWMGDDPGTVAYLQQCAALLGDVLEGRKSALETLFPNGSFALAEGLYETSEQARYVHPIMGSALRAAVQTLGRQRNVRILEIGGGTGGTTSAMLPLLPPQQVDYCFTDVSEIFLSRPQRKFREYGFVRYALFDIDRSFEEQGFRSGTCDVIVAANVIHAARNLEAALDQTQRLLCPGGVLIMLETTQHHSWFDMSTGLIEGWQHFEDAERQEHPLLAPDQWRSILERTGFEDTAILPGPESPASKIGQHVLLARRRLESELRIEVKVESARVTHNGWKAIPQSPPPAHAETVDELRGLSSELREQRVLVIVKETICRVFQLDGRPEELGDRDRLSDLGMDSLIALELRSELSKGLGLEGKISSTIAFDTGTVGELARSLVGLLTPRTEHLSRPADAQPVASRRKEQAQVTAEQLEFMSDEEVEQLLKARLSNQ